METNITGLSTNGIIGNYASDYISLAFSYPSNVIGGVAQTSRRSGIRGLGAGVQTLGSSLGGSIGKGVYDSILKNGLSIDSLKSGFSSGFRNAFDFSGGWTSPGAGLGMNAAGAILSAIGGPKQEYSGEKGAITKGLDSAYDIAQSAAAFIPGVGTTVSGLMSLNKGITGMLNKWGGGTDAMTDVDSVLGSNWFGPLGSINGFTGTRAHTMDGKDFMTQEQLGNMWSGYGDTFYNYQDALSKEGKKYGGLSSGSRRRANRIIDKANMDKEYLLDMNRGYEIGNIRGNNMAGIRGTAYNIALSGGFKPVSIGRLGFKISSLKEAINSIDKTPKKESVITPWKPTLEEIEKFLRGGKPKYVRSDLSYYDPETDTIYYSGDNRKSRKEAKRHEEFHRDPNNELIEYLKPYYENLDDKKITELGGDLNYVKRFEGDPNHFYNPEELGARLSAAAYRTRNAIDYSEDFFEKLRLDENKYGDNMRDLLHMYNNKNLAQMFSFFRRNRNTGGDFGGGVFINPDIAGGKPLYPTDEFEVDGLRKYTDGTGNRFTKYPPFLAPPESFKQGGSMNLIPEGSLHARLHHMEDADGLTKKGIPVVDNEGNQQAEIELNEIIFRKEVTDKLEELAKDGSNKAAEEAGRLLVEEIFENTEDRTGLIKDVTGEVAVAASGIKLPYFLRNYSTLLEGEAAYQKAIVEQAAKDIANLGSNAREAKLFFTQLGDAADKITDTLSQMGTDLKNKELQRKANIDLQLADAKQRELERLAIKYANELLEAYLAAQERQLYNENKLNDNKLMAQEGDKLPELDTKDIINLLLSLPPEKLKELLNILNYLGQ